MSLQYIIDGYNIINRNDFLIKHRLEDSRAGLLRFIRENNPCGSRRNLITVVFDGKAEYSVCKLDSRCKIIFTKNESADDKIKSMVEKSSNPKNIVVVTDDKQIKFFVRSLGAKIMTVQNFIQPTLEKNKAPLLEKELILSKARAITEELKKVWLK